MVKLEKKRRRRGRRKREEGGTRKNKNKKDEFIVTDNRSDHKFICTHNRPTIRHAGQQYIIKDKELSIITQV